ncbi:MAG: nitrophenyl compound nitroreductase subunit ArsF family protein [Planctomycetota bacterium]|nr:nitrophenyl compound nitroreductase subunit ArsF family protein [Planctomycetota bacterium]
MTTKKALSNLLLGFVLVSIGFAIGKETALNGARKTRASEVAAATPPAGSDKVIVYYMHQTFRCVTCNQIEAMTGELIRTDFAKELQDGRIEWKKVNFQEDENLAKRYNVASSTVVVVRLRNGKEIGHQSLDEVWMLSSNREEFIKYVSGAIREALAKEKA